MEKTVAKQLEQLAAAQGTPLFLLDAGRAAANYKEFLAAFSAFPRKAIYYSVKTNPLPQLITAIAREESGFEVASALELQTVLANAAGVPIAFNGPCKRGEELKLALENNALINADCESELEKIAAIKPGTRIGVRVSFEESKFGFEATKAAQSFALAEKLGLKPIALHSHPRSPCTLQEYKTYLEKYAKTMQQLGEAGYVLEQIDLGSGFPDKTTLVAEKRSLSEYAEAIHSALSPAVDFSKTTLALEPGRFIAADSMAILTRVHAIKQTFGRNWAILDAGINLVPSFAKAKLKWSKVGETKAHKGDRKQFILGGPLLFSVDSLGAFAENLEEGDLLLAENAGAYCYALRWQMGYGETKVVEAKF